MNNSKYFSVDISNDIHLVKLHKTLEEAKQSCLDGAVDAYDFANDMDSFEEYSECDVPYAIYGAILGRVVSTTRELTDEEYESGDYCDDEITNPPEIVEINGWISTEERLPKLNGEVFKCSSKVLCFGQRDYTNEPLIFIGYMIEDGSFYSDNGECYKVSHWQPLPQLPKEY